MIILGIETSCDETAIALVNDKREVLAHVIASQIEAHAKYGGVVPELASRNHLDAIPYIYQQTIEQAGIDQNSIDAIAVTSGPGLIGGLLVGVMFAKGLALALKKPLISVNHLEAHALTPRFTEDVEFPFLLLLVSGGHCQILEVHGVGKYTLVGKTRDDSVGEAFDKVAKMMGLPYPGGPIIEKMARLGDADSIDLPIPILRDTPCDFSFSGLKSAVKRIVDQNQPLSDEFKNNMAASFQKTVGLVLADRIKNSIAEFSLKHPQSKQIVIAGGVAANQYLKSEIANTAAEFGFAVSTPPIKLCTDNGVMVAWAGLERFRLGLTDNSLFEPRSRWPLSEVSHDKKD